MENIEKLNSQRADMVPCDGEIADQTLYSLVNGSDLRSASRHFRLALSKSILTDMNSVDLTQLKDAVKSTAVSQLIASGELQPSEFLDALQMMNAGDFSATRDIIELTREWNFRFDQLVTGKERPTARDLKRSLTQIIVALLMKSKLLASL